MFNSNYIYISSACIQYDYYFITCLIIFNAFVEIYLFIYFILSVIYTSGYMYKSVMSASNIENNLTRKSLQPFEKS